MQFNVTELCLLVMVAVSIRQRITDSAACKPRAVSLQKAVLPSRHLRPPVGERHHQ